MGAAGGVGGWFVGRVDRIVGVGGRAGAKVKADPAVELAALSYRRQVAAVQDGNALASKLLSRGASLAVHNWSGRPTVPAVGARPDDFSQYADPQQRRRTGQHQHLPALPPNSCPTPT